VSRASRKKLETIFVKLIEIKMSNRGYNGINTIMHNAAILFNAFTSRTL